MYHRRTLARTGAQSRRGRHERGLNVSSIARRGLSRALRSVSMLLWLAGKSVGQPSRVIRITDDLSCGRCTITSRTIVTMGAEAGAGALNFSPALVRDDGRGRYWVRVGVDPPRVFDSGGRFLRMAGRPGQGPGEFFHPSFLLALPGDSMLVVDEGFATVFDADLLDDRRITMRATLYPAIILSWPGDIIAVGNRPGPTWGVNRVHRVSFAGRDVQFIESLPRDSAPPLRQPYPPNFLQTLAAAGANSFWTADRSLYNVLKWRRDSGFVQVVQRRPRWFPDRSKLGIGSPREPPPPYLVGLHQDEAGRLWLFTRIAADTWRSAWDGVPKAAVEVRAAQIDQSKLFTAVVEVIDPVLAKVIARRFLGEDVFDVLPSGRVASYKVDANGVGHLVILELTLSGTGKQ